mmetsp:Transcript_24765/g.36526  ORF Transcript_24765/g.36526 Transcript_24765/m.36526 type:complete len:442 (+) Transcript_24765:39-1364(+)
MIPTRSTSLLSRGKPQPRKFAPNISTAARPSRPADRDADGDKSTREEASSSGAPVTQELTQEPQDKAPRQTSLRKAPTSSSANATNTVAEATSAPNQSSSPPITSKTRTVSAPKPSNGVFASRSVAPTTKRVEATPAPPQLGLVHVPPAVAGGTMRNRNRAMVRVIPSAMKQRAMHAVVCMLKQHETPTSAAFWQSTVRDLPPAPGSNKGLKRKHRGEGTPTGAYGGSIPLWSPSAQESGKGGKRFRDALLLPSHTQQRGQSYTYVTAYVKRKKHGLGLRLKDVGGHAVVVGFNDEYLAAQETSGAGNAADICIGDIIVAVENLDTSNPANCPFERVVAHLSNAGESRVEPLSVSHPNHVLSSTCVWDSDPLNLNHRTSSLAKYNDTVCIRLARPSDCDTIPYMSNGVRKLTVQSEICEGGGEIRNNSEKCDKVYIETHEI